MMGVGWGVTVHNARDLPGQYSNITSSPRLGGFFLVCKDFGTMFNNSFPASASHNYYYYYWK